MPNEYSIEIHRYLSEKFDAAEKSFKKGELTKPTYQGRIEELRWIRKYLKDNIDLKDFTYY